MARLFMSIIGSQSLEQLRKLSHENSWDLIAVRHPRHHTAMKQALFERALDEKKSIRYLARSFNSAFHDPKVIESLHDYISCGGDIKVLIWDLPNVGGEVESRIRELEKLSWHFDLMTTGTREMGDQIAPVFIVDDSVAYNFACHPYYGDTKFDGSRPEMHAKVQFGGKDGVRKSTEYFDTLWNACSEAQSARTKSCSPPAQQSL
jgi:hypothetical protein